MRETIAERLANVGLTRNESLAFITLLEEADEAGMTGYEVAARSGIPRSAVYNVLRRLERLGGAFATGERPARYTPADPKRFVRDLRSQSNQRFDDAATALASLAKRATPEPVWVLSRYAKVLERAERMVQSAEATIWVSAWPRELTALADALVAATQRGVRAVVHSPDSVPVDLFAQATPALSVWDDQDLDPTRSQWAHRVLLVVDRGEALIGGAEPQTDNQAVWSSNPSLVDVATQHIVLDVTLLAARRGASCAPDVSAMLSTTLRPATMSDPDAA